MLRKEARSFLTAAALPPTDSIYTLKIKGHSQVSGKLEAKTTKMLLTIFLASLFVLFLVTYIYLSKYRGVVESFGLPYIKPFFIFGSPPFMFHTFNYHDWEAEQFKKFGKTWAKYDGSIPVIRTIDPEFIKEVTVKQFDNFHASFDVPITDEQTTLDMAKGETWKALRKILSPTFTTGRLKGR